MESKFLIAGCFYILEHLAEAHEHVVDQVEAGLEDEGRLLLENHGVVVQLELLVIYLVGNLHFRFRVAPRSHRHLIRSSFILWFLILLISFK